MAEVPPELAAEVQKLERYHAENPQGRYFVPLANAYRKMGEVEQAEALLREGLRRHPDYLSAHIVLGRCLADRGAAEDAVGEFRYVLSVDPQNLIALRSLGELATEGGRSDEAARWYRELLAVDPMNDDARQALESLEAATSAPASAEQPGGGLEDWERAEEAGVEEGVGDFGMIPDPLGWGVEGADSEAAPTPDAGNEAASWGEISLDIESPGETPREEPEPAADLYGGIDLGSMELTDTGATAPAEPEPWSAGETGGWDPLGGGTIELDRPTFEGAEDADEGEVVTETIAELYARQGFYDRAAEVYRELIRRRGGDPSLEDRLQEMELRATGRFPEEEAGAAASIGDVELGGPPDLAPVDSDTTGWVEAEPEPWGPPVEEPSAAGGDADAFASSFEAGFGEAPPETPREDVLPAFAEVADEAEPAVEEAWGAPGAEPVFAADASFFGGEEEREEVPAPPAAPPPAAQDVTRRSVRDYLASLAGWAPGAGVADTVAPTSAPVAEPEPARAGTADEDEDLPWLAAPVSGESGDAGVMEVEGLLPEEPVAEGAAPAAPEPEAAEDEPYPWEVAPVAEPAAPAPSAGSAFSFEEFFTEAAETPAPEAVVAPAPEPRAAEPAQPEAQPTGEGDEDLESFQAWLQSLKR